MILKKVINLSFLKDVNSEDLKHGTYFECLTDSQRELWIKEEEYLRERHNMKLIADETLEKLKRTSSG